MFHNNSTLFKVVQILVYKQCFNHTQVSLLKCLLLKVLTRYSLKPFFVIDNFKFVFFLTDMKKSNNSNAR